MNNARAYTFTRFIIRPSDYRSISAPSKYYESNQKEPKVRVVCELN